MKKTGIAAKIYLSVVTALFFVPIAITVIYSFNASKMPSQWSGFSLVWYGELFRDREAFSCLVNSVVLGLLSCAFSVVIGTAGALGMHGRMSRLDRFVRWICVLPVMIPEVILGMAYLAVFSLLGLPFGMVTLVIAHTTFCVPYVFLVVSGRLSGLNMNAVMAARDLGATPMEAFRDVTLPMLLPGIASGVILSFAMSFDDVIISVFVAGAGVNTLPVHIYTRLKTGVTPEINALSALLVLAVAAGVILVNAVLPKKRR